MRQRLLLCLMLGVCLARAASVAAQDVRPEPEVQLNAPTQHTDKDDPAASAPAAPSGDATQSPPVTELDRYNIGGLPEEPRGEYYQSPLKKFGYDLFLGTYALNALTSFVYFVVVYPVQLLVGSSKPQGAVPWLFLPVIGPWMAQYTDDVKDKLFWRVVFIADAGLQVTGLLIGLLGELLSGHREKPREPNAGLDVHFGVRPGGGAMLTVTCHTL